MHSKSKVLVYRLDCAECLDDQRLVAWARKEVSMEFSAAVLTKSITQAQVDALKTRIEERRNDVDARFERIEARLDGYHPSSK